MIKCNDFKKIQELIIIRDTAQNAASELNALLLITNEMDRDEIRLIIDKLDSLAENTISEILKMVDWSEEE